LIFFAEREQYKARVRKEEAKVTDLLKQIAEIKESVLELQRESPSPLPDTPVADPHPPAATASSLTVTLPEPVQQTARLTPGPSLSPPPTQASPDPNRINNRPTRPPVAQTVKMPTLDNQRLEAGNPRPVIVPNITQRPALPAMTAQRPAANAIVTLRNTETSISNLRSATIGQRPASVTNQSEGKLRAGIQRPLSAQDILDEKAPSVMSTSLITTSKSISTTVAPRPNSAPNTQAAVTVTRPLGQTQRQAIISARPVTAKVPPHLANLQPEPRFINVAGGVKTEGPVSPRSPVSLVSPTGASAGPNRQKPPPPVRNVSLPPRRAEVGSTNTS